MIFSFLVARVGGTFKIRKRDFVSENKTSIVTVLGKFSCNLYSLLQILSDNAVKNTIYAKNTFLSMFISFSKLLFSLLLTFAFLTSLNFFFFFSTHMFLLIRQTTFERKIIHSHPVACSPFGEASSVLRLLLTADR